MNGRKSAAFGDEFYSDFINVLLVFSKSLCYNA